MKIEIHEVGNKKVAEVLSDEIIVRTVDDGLDLLGNLYFQGFDKVIIFEKNIAHEFFDLKTGIAGEILQKFSNYKVRLGIVGDFSKYTSKSLAAFMYESNKGKSVNFVSSTTDALSIFSAE